ncbi:hypothetical protein [Gynuella sunshinyii]|uniref:DUF4124 domain-containing protein n=1 Tax=Gynuella sunshinyii YC6258 TaxID=1445510 RepID=A0A0C5VEY7_9GAMM|nr:hypothetical protein [Gynuella sunshinyii]AJQ93127.1 hypothetical Protein YC6258_01079 [Gynuella sunshinyii YC6258]
MKSGKQLVCIVVFMTAGWTAAANLYRYTDQNGTLVLESMIPPEFVSKGYEILNEQGQVLKVVPPAPSAEELAKKKAEQERLEMQSARDAELMKLYRSPEDVDRAKASWMSRLDVEIKLKRNQLTIRQTELDELRSQAASLERVNKPIPEALLQQMQEVQSLMEAINVDIQKVEARKVEDEKQFELDKQRVAELIKNKQK